MTMSTDTTMPALLLGEAGSDPIEDRLRATVRDNFHAAGLCQGDLVRRKNNSCSIVDP